MKINLEYETALARSLPSTTTRKTPTWSRLVQETAKDYADSSTIDGVRYFAGSNVRFLAIRLIWFLLFCGSFATGIAIFVPIWKSFMSDAVKDTTEYDAVAEFQLPAFTLCSMNSARRSVVGGSPNLYKYFLRNSLYPESTYQSLCAEIPYYAKEPKLAAQRRTHTTLFHNITTLSNFGYVGQMLVAPTVYQSVQSCKFKGLKLTDEECYSTFQNRLTRGKGYCFTFNPADYIRKSVLSVAAATLGFESAYIDSTFPSPLVGMMNYTVKTKGRASAFEMLLNTQQYEYCGVGSSDGAGFEMQVHSRAVQPIMPELNDDVIQLSPGKEITITIEERRIVKETESAGSSVKLDYYKHQEAYEDRDACINECVTKRIAKSCGCIPTYSPSMAYFDWITKNFNKSSIQKLGSTAVAAIARGICLETKLICVNQLINYLVVEKSLTEECSYCKEPCFQKKYLVHKTESNFPAMNTFDLYKDLKHPKINYTALRAINNQTLFHQAVAQLQFLDPRTHGAAEPFADYNEIRSNLLYLRIQAKTLNVVIHKESFAVTLSELITQMGGAISLFTGASALSLAELLFWCACPCLARSKKYRSVINKC